MATAEIATHPPAAVTPGAPLRVTFAWTLAGNIIYAGCQWGMISVLAKLGNTKAVGQFALALAITAPVFMLTNLALRGVQATDARSEFLFEDYFSLRVIGTATALLAVLAISLVNRRTSSLLAIVACVALAKAVESLTDIIAGLLQKHERLDQVAISMMLKGICSVVAFGIVFAASHNVTAASAALFVTWSVVFLSYDLQRSNRILGSGGTYFLFDRRRLLKLAKLAAPVGVVLALVSLNVNIPRYVVEKYCGTSQLGIFAALSYLVVVANLLVNALGQSAVVRLSRHFANGSVSSFTHLLQKMCLLAMAGAFLALILAHFFGQTALRLLYGPEYQGYMAVLLVMVGSSGVSAIASFLGYGMTAARRFREQLPVFVATLATCGIVSLLLTPRFGIMGAAWAIALASVAQVLGSFWVLRSAVRSRRQGDEVRESVELQVALANTTNE